MYRLLPLFNRSYSRALIEKWSTLRLSGANCKQIECLGRLWTNICMWHHVTTMINDYGKFLGLDFLHFSSWLFGAGNSLLTWRWSVFWENPKQWNKGGERAWKTWDSAAWVEQPTKQKNKPVSRIRPTSASACSALLASSVLLSPIASQAAWMGRLQIYRRSIHLG